MHIPVLLKETLEALALRPGGRYIDGTLGGGSHSEAILEASNPNSRLLGLDRDPDAITRCKARLSKYGDRFTCVHADFASMKSVAEANGFDQVDGILLDLGVSSFQLDEPERGFSFMNDGPLDMRMDTSKGMTAADLLQSLGDDWRKLASILGTYGEEPQAARIAKVVLAEQAKCPIQTTKRLADIIEKAVGGRRGSPRHPATRAFQAIRIVINAETEQASAGIEAALTLLAENGRLAVITFHSIEDRIAKQTLAEHAGKMVSLQQGGEKWEGREPAVLRIHRRPVTPSAEEIFTNPRSRSAKLRVVQRLATQD